MKNAILLIWMGCNFSLAEAQKITQAGIYGAANTGTAGNLSVNWVIGTLVPSTISPLPVRLISFKGRLTSAGNALLEWKTAQEVNNQGFEVQKSVDGKIYLPIGWVDGGVNHEEEKMYYFTDNDLKTTSYYRLKQIDLDGTYTLSRIASVIPEMESLERLVAYPNPSENGNVNVILPERASSLILISNRGKTILEKKNPTAKLMVHLPATGLYFLTIQTTVGQKTLKLIRK
jgi:hypothetical protein